MTGESFQMILARYRQLYAHGQIHLLPGEKISGVIKAANVPSQRGVYIVTGESDNQHEVLYIGKSGTVKNDGTFQKQTLRKRLRMKHDGEYRDIVFLRWMAEKSLRKLTIEYFVIDQELPAYVEAELMQHYFYEFGRLPAKNAKY